MRAIRFVGLVVVVAVIASAVLHLLFGAPASALPSGVLALLPAVLTLLLSITIAVQLSRWLFGRIRSR